MMLTTGSRSRGYKMFFMLNSTEPEFYPAHKCQNANNIISRINDWLGDFNLKFPSINALSIFMSRLNFILS